MDRPFVEHFRIESYGCVQDLDLKLTPIHALIGPNDSGKSTILAALQTAATLAVRQTPSKEPTPHTRRFLDSIGARLTIRTNGIEWRLRNDANGWIYESGANLPKDELLQIGSLVLRQSRELSQAIRGAQLLRLDPDALRTPSQLIQHGQPIRFENERGLGLPALYDALLSRNLDAFISIREQLKKLFPAVRTLELINASQSTKALNIKIDNGRSVPAEHMSEGLLYYLAYTVLPYLEPNALLLVEEPENGLHPARIIEVMRGLKEVAKTTQVLIATHSPLVVNELDGREISVVTRDPQHGTKAIVLAETPDYAERSKVYSNGELWVSYADGDQEAALVKGGPRP